MLSEYGSIKIRGVRSIDAVTKVRPTLSNINPSQTAVRVSMQVKGEARFRGREVCRELLSHGASPNLVPSNQLASLDVACEEGDVELMQVKLVACHLAALHYN